MKMFGVSIIVLLIIQITCAQHPQPHQEQLDEKQFGKSQTVRFASTPSSSKEGHIIIKSDCIYFYTDDALWRIHSNGQQWELLYTRTPKFATNNLSDPLQKAIVLNEKTIWIIFIDHVLKSSDSGRTWTDIKPPVDLIVDLGIADDVAKALLVGRQHKASDARSGCYYEAGNGNDTGYYVFLSSSDVGSTWELVNYPCSVGFLEKIVSFDQLLHRFISMDSISIYQNNSWQIKKVSELSCRGKKVFSRQEIKERTTETQFPIWSTLTILDGFFLNQKTGWVVLSTGDLLRTDNNGIDWCRTVKPEDVWTENTELTNYFTQVKFSDENYGAVLDDDDTLFVTNNGGQNLKAVPGYQVKSFAVQGGKLWFLAGSGVYQLDIKNFLGH